MGSYPVRTAMKQKQKAALKVAFIFYYGCIDSLLENAEEVKK
jgi:hypothetical protein